MKNNKKAIKVVRKLVVFVSAVIRNDELAEELKFVCKLIESGIFESVQFDCTSPEPTPPRTWSLNNVEECDIFVQILDKTISDIVKEEYETAKNYHKPQLIFVKDNSNRDHELMAFIDYIKHDVKYKKFTTIEEFEKFLKESLDQAILKTIREKTQKAEDIKKSTEFIEDFRTERLELIKSGNLSKLLNLPKPLDEGPKIALHLVPFRAFDSGSGISLRTLIPFVKEYQTLLPIATSLVNHGRINSDGYLTCWEKTDTSVFSYLQIFYNGCIESVDTSLLKPSILSPRGIQAIPSSRFEKKLIDALLRFLSIEKQLGIDPPFFIMLSLLGASGYKMAVKREFDDSFEPWWQKPTSIDSDELIIPKIPIENFESDFNKAAKIMKPIFDAVSCAARGTCSVNFDSKGNWKG